MSIGWTPNIGWMLLFADVVELRQRCHILWAFVDNGWHKALHIQRCMHCNGFACKWQWMASNLERSRSLGLKTIIAWHVCFHVDVLRSDKWESLSDDIEVMTRHEHDDPIVTLFEDALKDRALYEIDHVLIYNKRRLEDFPTFPKSNYIPPIHGGNQLVQEELVYN